MRYQELSAGSISSIQFNGISPHRQHYRIFAPPFRRQMLITFNYFLIKFAI
ncbi:MAG: hypothetical protein MUC60_09400 [Oscillatoria sp. Prado101]|nr:hypothetical protein [Oscillatoria sp. Prado101]